MPELPTLTITAPNGSERATLTGERVERDRHVTDRSRARFALDAARWQTVADSINRRADRFRIDAAGETGWFGGRFRDTERGGQQVTVILDDYERDARDAQPTGGQVLFQNVDDATVVQDAISRIPTLSAGTIQTVATGLSFSFSNAEPAKMIRDAAQPGGALVRYNADRTVDFVARPATGSEPELSTAANTLVGEPDVSDDNRNPPTEIIGLGAQSGPNQVRATATVDPTAARDVYRRYENKDIQQQDRLQTTVDRLADEVAAAENKLDVEAGAINLDVRPGDPLAFVWPARGIDETVRVIEFTEVVNERGQRYAPLRVSNRWPEQGGSDKAIEDLERFNRGYQGFIDRDNFSLDNQPVTASLNAEDSYFYPDDVITEVRSEIRIRGRPYRAFSSGGANNPSFGEEDVSEGSSGSVSVTDESWTTIANFDPAGGEETQSVTYTGSVEDFASPDRIPGRTDMDLRLRFNFGSSNVTRSYWPTEGGYDAMVVGDDVGRNIQFFSVTLPGPYYTLAQVELQVRIDALQGSTGLEHQFSGVLQAIYEQTHTHPPNPGVTEFSNLLPSNCDILINGTPVGVSLGDGATEFAETVDITGLLSPGDNDIEITSDSTGRITGAVRTELFRQGPEDTA